FGLFCVLALAAHARQRVRAWGRRRRREVIHSRYIGTSDFLLRLRRVWPGLTPMACWRWLEPLTCGAAGVMLLEVSQLPGLYLIVAGGAMSHTAFRLQWREQEMASDTRDGMIDMEAHQARVNSEWDGDPDDGPAAVVTEAAPLRQPPPAPEPP